MSKRNFEPVLTPSGPIELPLQYESEAYPTDDEIELGLAQSAARLEALWMADLEEIRSESAN